MRDCAAFLADDGIGLPPGSVRETLVSLDSYAGREKRMLVGLISDTHGQFRDAVIDAFAGVDLILHAGDVGRPAVLDPLRRIAPVHAVRGNVDADGLFPPSIDLELEGARVHVSHGDELGSPTPQALAGRYEADVIVFGHTHRPVVETLRGRLIVNPGAAGAARFGLKPSVALLDLPARTARIVLL